MERSCPRSSELLLAEQEKTKDGSTGRGCGKLPLWQAASRVGQLLGGLALWWTRPQVMKVSPEGKDRACDLSKSILSRTFSLCCPISWSVYPHSLHTGVTPSPVPSSQSLARLQGPLLKRACVTCHPRKLLSSGSRHTGPHSTLSPEPSHLPSPTSLLGTLGRQSEHPGISRH